MEQYQSPLSTSNLNAFPQVPTGPLNSIETFQSPTNDIDMAMADDEHTLRAASVLSGMSADEKEAALEAAQTLNSLHANLHSPPRPQSLPIHLQTTTSYDADTQPEPLLSLVTSQYPLAASLINGSLSAYKTTQSFIPGAELIERKVGLPLAGTIGRYTGVEGGIRYMLQRRESAEQSRNRRRSELGPLAEHGNSMDVEKGYGEQSANVRTRRSSHLSLAESLPAYDEAGRSPPYQEQPLVLQSRERQPPPGWRQQLMITTSGLGIAMSDESLRSLRYCLSWLTWANHRLGGAVQSLKDLLRRWDPAQQSTTQPMLPHISDQGQESPEAVLTRRIAALKTDVLNTLKQVVDIVSKYAGGALPENARSLVHRHLTSLPQRFSIASASSSNAEGGDAAGGAHRVMVLAQEGLEMMTQVSRVVNDTLVSAESWCEKLGRRQSQQPQHGQYIVMGEKAEDIQESHENGGDAKMEM